MPKSSANPQAQADRQPAHRQPAAKATAGPTPLAAPPDVQLALADPAAASPEAILALQRTGGNRAVQRLLAGHLQRQAAVGPEGGELDPGLSRTIQSARGGGHALEPKLGSRVGQSLGADFSSVRVHTDSQADQLNRSMGANAFTYGRDIFFRQGQYNPGSSSGQRLVAHELTHVVQQGGARSNKVQPKLSVGPADDGYEREADRVASQVLKPGGQPAPSLSAGPRVQRFNPFKSLAKRFGSKNKGPKRTNDQKVFEKTGEVPVTSTPYFVLRIAVGVGTETRGNAKTISEYLRGIAGHAWIELDLGPDFNDTDDLADGDDGDRILAAMESSTKAQLDDEGTTSIGFYPKADNISWKALLKQLFTNLPGGALEPEQDHFRGQAKGSKGYVITEPEQALNLFGYLRGNRSRPYNLLKYNCTDWALDAVRATGFAPPKGRTSMKSRITSPNLLYRRIYQSMRLGDKTANVADLKKATSKSGRKYDWAHIEKAGEKKLDQRIAARAKKPSKFVAPKTRSLVRAPRKPTYTEPTPPPGGHAYVVSDELSVGMMDGMADQTLAAGAQFYLLDDRDPATVEDSWQAWMDVWVNGKMLRALAYDIAQHAKPGTLDTMVGEEAPKEEEKPDLAPHVADGVYRVTIPAGATLPAFRDEEATDGNPWRFEEDTPVRIKVYPLSKQHNRCRVEFSGKQFYTNIDELFDESGNVKAPKPEAAPPPPEMRQEEEKPTEEAPKSDETEDDMEDIPLD